MSRRGRGAQQDKHVKLHWDEEDDVSEDEKVDDEVLKDYMQNTDIGENLEAESSRRFHTELDKIERDEEDYSESEEEDEVDEAIAAEEDHHMRYRNDAASRPFVHNRNSYKRDGAKFSVDEALARHRDDEYQLAVMTMAKRGSGSGSLQQTFGARGSDANAYVRYGKEYSGDFLEAIYSECKKIVAFASSGEDRLTLAHAMGPQKRAVISVAERCGVIFSLIGHGRSSRPLLLRSNGTSPISLDKMEEAIDEALSYRRQKGGRNGRGDRDRGRGGPPRLTPKKERRMRELEDTANGAPLQESNAGHAMLRMMGWSQGTGLGVNKDGRTEPVPVKINSTRKGLGSE
eukprot:Plantae.Rhodophyta-Purpureofilum_apyrenoidigerum.ctg11463.p1 GENE.Plantae.Rhodophyta-Purpureofilum_apyrenoidigerum.ctg11463~~Plantae.Rhodophyta-Purpureofilum_apyrenoidigerum.ctg11463.p1  ORF type:complete len:345 (-),score=66.99 Plantae.Rhodophyta-Purpureofilum_apyrenoidigerum.ctg11463:357-1391(-)